MTGVGLALVVGLLLVSTSGFAQGETKIVWAGWWDQEWGRDTIDWIVSTFEETHPNVEVETMYVPHAQYSDKLLTLCQAGECPDIMGMEVTWAEAFDRLGMLKDLEPFFESEGEAFMTHYNPGWQVFWNGKTVMAYLYTQAYGVGYNVKMFEDKGLEPPTNWVEFKEALRKFRDPQARRWGAALPFAMKSSCHFMLYDFWTRLIQAGGHMVDENGLARFDSPAGIRTLEYWKSLVDEGLVYPGTTTGALAIGEKEFVELFAGEQVPMITSGPFFAPKARQRNPGIRVAFAPPFEDATGGYLITGSGVAISSQTEHPELAWEFFKHLVSYQVAAKMVEENSLAWANTVALDAPTLKEDPVLGPMSAMVANPASQSWTVLPRLGELCEVVTQHSQEYFLGRKSARTALDEAADTWNEIIQQAKQ
ncbi:MAG: ABC transporter substrate-binding protein [Candidatus Bipolaricaulia bacterium]